MAGTTGLSASVEMTNQRMDDLFGVGSSKMDWCVQWGRVIYGIEMGSIVDGDDVGGL
jgi:hypothetical protein